MAYGQKNQDIKQKQYCNKFNKGFKKKKDKLPEPANIANSLSNSLVFTPFIPPPHSRDPEQPST